MQTAENELAQMIPDQIPQGYTPNCQQPLDLVQIQTQVIASPEQLTQIYVQGYGIKDEVKFDHRFTKKVPCICGDFVEKSSFLIEDIGLLEYGYQYEVCCSCAPSCGCCTFCCKSCFKCFQCDQHFYPHPDYLMDNKAGLRMEFWQNGIGKIKIKELPVIDFIQTFPNVCDSIYGHCYSSYPKLLISYALGFAPTRLELFPDKSSCPESICSLLPLFAVCGMGKNLRKFTVTGLRLGTCEIINTRTCGEACAKICYMQGCCCLPDIDYPHFEVKFSKEVPQLDRLAILMGLVHYSMFKKWYVMTQITRSVVGVA